MEKRRRLFEVESRLANIKRNEIIRNLNYISKDIVKKLSLDPEYENVTMGQVKKILNDNFVTPEAVTASNSIVIKNLQALRKGMAIDPESEDTDTDTKIGTR